MARLSVLKNFGPRDILGGVYGSRNAENPNVFEADPALRRFYLFSLMPSIEVDQSNVIDIEIDDFALPALKATLVHHISKKWDRAYASVTDLPSNPLIIGMLKEERKVVSKTSKEVVSELGFKEPNRISFKVLSLIPEKEPDPDLSDLEDEPQCSSACESRELHVLNALSHAVSVEMLDGHGFVDGLPVEIAAGPQPCECEAYADFEAFGDSRQLGEVKRIMPILLQNGILRPREDENGYPVAAFVSYRPLDVQLRQDEEGETPRT